MPGGLSCELSRRMPYRRAEPSETARTQRGDAPRDRVSVRLGEILHHCDLHVRRMASREGIDGVQITERIERLCREHERDLLEVDDAPGLIHALIGRPARVDEQRDRQAATRGTRIEVEPLTRRIAKSAIDRRPDARLEIERV